MTRHGSALFALGAFCLGACAGADSQKGAMQLAGAAADGDSAAGAASDQGESKSAGASGLIGSGGTRSTGMAASGTGGMAATPPAGGAMSGAEQGGRAAVASAGRGGENAGAAGAARPAETPAADGCGRDLLAATVKDFFDALAAHDSARLPVASMVKFTENGKTVQLGEGLWKTAGMAKLKRSALDTETCATATESVVTEGSVDIVVGLRLKLVARKITEIESIVVRDGDYLSNPMTLLGTADDDWETVLPADQRASREVLMTFVTRYFSQFPMGGCNFASECERFENGFTPGKCSLGLSCSMSADGMGRSVMPTRLALLDVEAGIAVEFTMFQGRYTDFHMFKVRGGMVVGVHAVLAEASSSGW